MADPVYEHPLGFQIYADLMNEARIRLGAIREIINARDSWAPRLLQEFVYLQLRMLCEIVAVGCLVAHGNIKNPDILRTWKLPLIIKKLHEISPDFYPLGIRIVSTPKGPRIEDYLVPQLSKAELITLWTKTGNFLHRGNARDLLTERREEFVVNIGALAELSQRMMNLLDQHIISWPGRKKHLLVALSGNGGLSQVWPLETGTD